MTMGCVQCGTSRFAFLQNVGSRKIVSVKDIADGPVRAAVHPLQVEFAHPRPSSGVIVAHFTPTPYSAMACVASTVT
jgi:hypothetical protein